METRNLLNSGTDSSAVDLNQYVESWQTDRAPSIRLIGETVRGPTADSIPADKPFPSSHFTRRTISEALSKVPTSGSTANRYRAAWCSFGNYLVEIEVLDNNPVKAVKAPRNNPPRELYLSLAEVRGWWRTTGAVSINCGTEGGGRRRDWCRPDSSQARYRREESVCICARHEERLEKSARLVEDWAWPYIEAASRGKLQMHRSSCAQMAPQPRTPEPG